MKDLIDKIKGKINELRQSANTALAKLLPMEQQEGAQECAAIFRAARNCVEYLAEIGGIMEGKVTEFAEELKTVIRAELKVDETFRQEIARDPKLLETIKQELVKAGDLFSKTDLEGRIEAAEKAAKSAGKTEATEAAQAEKLITDRRTEAAASLTETLKKSHGADAPKVAAELASKLTDEQLKGEGYKTVIADTAGRIGKCVGLGVHKTQILQEAASVDAAAFEKLHEGWKDVSERAGKGRAAAPLATSAAGTTGAATEEKKTPVLV
jgi:hypothetical protein